MKNLRYLLMAALVAMPLTACDDDDGPTGKNLVGTVTGTVAAEGTGLSGVGVTLVGATSQSATTGAGGTYTFTNVAVGSYGVSIDASTHTDVSFSQTSKATSISAADEVATVDFGGSYIRTATITGVVTASGTPLGGVAVTVTGGPDNVTNNSVTNAGGEYFATGLRAGSYTVTIPAQAGVDFTSTSAAVTVATGETKTAHFPGVAVQMATISGAVTIDNVGVAGIPVALSGDAVANTETGPGGAFAFTNLDPGAYTVTITAPDETEFDVTFKDVDVMAGETGVVNFSGKGPVEPATISIQGITKGGEVIDLTDVSGQVEVTVNVTRNDQILDYVDVLIGDVVVATQDFANQASPAEAAGDDETITLNVPTTQVMMGTNGIWTPAVNNGGNEVSALLYVVGGEQPIPTNRVPVVVQNPDALLPGLSFGGDLLISPDEPDRTAMNGDDVWYAGSATLTGPIFLSYTTETPSEVAFIGSCADITDEITGDYMTGISVTNTYGCAGETAVLGVLGTFWVDYDNYVGPDGTAVTFYGWNGECGFFGPKDTAPTEPGEYSECGMFALGAEFFLSDGTIGPRRFVIPNPVEGQIEEPNTLNMDNEAPGIELDNVAFNPDFDEYWVKGDFDFLSPIDSWDNVSGMYGVEGIVEKAFMWTGPEADDCGGPEVTTPAAAGLAETMTSDDAATGESYAICAYAEDALGNFVWTTMSNSFGVDMTAPSVRIWGDDDSAAPTNPVPVEVDNGTSDTPVSDAMNQTIFGSTNQVAPVGYDYAYDGDRDLDMEWGLDAIDDRSGFDNLTGWPFTQVVTAVRDAATAVTPDMAYGETGYGAILADDWVRVDGGTDFLAGLDPLGIFTYEGYVTDRAGNQSAHIMYNWMVDEDTDYPMTTDILGALTYAVGAPAMFKVWGEDDLEITEVEFTLTHPADFGPGYIDFAYPAQTVAADRWDHVFVAELMEAEYGIDQVWGRFDFTNADGTIPGSFTAGDEVFPTEATVYVSEDAGYNVGVVPEPLVQWTFIEYDIGGWSNPVEAAWDTENITSWTMDDTGWTALHTGETSVDQFVFEEVWLAAMVDVDGTPTLHKCQTVDTYDYLDNGTNRLYTYTFTAPTTGGGVCDSDGPAESWHAVGVDGLALLVTYFEEL